MVTWSTACLRIFSEELEVAKISEILGQEASKTTIKDDLSNPRNPNSQKNKYNVWVMDSGISNEEKLDAHVKAVITFLEKKQQEIDSIRNQCEYDIFCGISFENQGGILLSSETIKGLSHFPVDLVFDVYD